MSSFLRCDIVVFLFLCGCPLFAQTPNKIGKELVSLLNKMS